ncbi:MAG: NADPH-dependent FMN reductase [Spirochaetales bacterium]
MNIVALAGSVAGSRTRTAVGHTVAYLSEHAAGHTVTTLDLADYTLAFSDGRNYLDYTGDTAVVVRRIMEADVLIVGSPVFQASIPGALKNVFDLLPSGAFRDKVVAMIVTAGSPRHYLIPEIQLKPILTYLKAHVVEDYVFIEDREIHRGDIVEDDARLRIERLVDDTLTLASVYAEVRARKDKEYGF